MHDVVIRNGTVYDGEGGMPYAADVAIDGDRISAVMAAVGDRGRREIDGAGLAVAPGFINMLSWAIPSLIADGRAQSDVRQGVTLEVFGEGSSMGPLTDELVGLSEATGGTYISHLRNEGDRLLEAVDELIEITRRARVRGEIYHLKEAGRANWSKLRAVIERVESARAAGLDITADMY